VARKIPAHHARVMPYLHYHDPNAAIDFLTKAFGFTLRFAHREAGVVRHAQLGVGDTTFMLGPAYPDFRSAAASALPALHASIWCYVDDVDAHFARARAAGALILREPADQPYGVREYDALDQEGQEWYFCQLLDAGKMAPQARRKAAKKKPRAKAAKAARRPAKRTAGRRRRGR
jgi:PhnB protein